MQKKLFFNHFSASLRLCVRDRFFITKQKRTSIQPHNHGYTLMEVLISLSMFIAIAVPMLAAVATNTGTLRSQEALMASWILEQEAAGVRLFPEDVAPIKYRVVDGKSWTITIDAQGSPLRKFELVAVHKGKKCGKVIVYGMVGK
jgi:hypothetical protein